MGGLKHFHGYHLVATEQVHKALLRPSVRNLVFANMLPYKTAASSGKCCEVRVQTPQNRLSEHFLCRYFEQVYDLLGRREHHRRGAGRTLQGADGDMDS